MAKDSEQKELVDTDALADMLKSIVVQFSVQKVVMQELLLDILLVIRTPRTSARASSKQSW